jgi:hypothetical protein
VAERILANKYGPKPTVVVQNNQQTNVSLDPSEAAAIYQNCYAMLPVDFLTSPHHQLYWINDVVQMTRALLLECRRIGLRIS